MQEQRRGWFAARFHFRHRHSDDDSDPCGVALPLATDVQTWRRKQQALSLQRLLEDGDRDMYSPSTGVVLRNVRSLFMHGHTVLAGYGDGVLYAWNAATEAANEPTVAGRRKLHLTDTHRFGTLFSQPQGLFAMEDGLGGRAPLSVVAWCGTEVRIFDVERRQQLSRLSLLDRLQTLCCDVQPAGANALLTTHTDRVSLRDVRTKHASDLAAGTDEDAFVKACMVDDTAMAAVTDTHDLLIFDMRKLPAAGLGSATAKRTASTIDAPGDLPRSGSSHRSSRTGTDGSNRVDMHARTRGRRKRRQEQREPLARFPLSLDRRCVHLTARDGHVYATAGAVHQIDPITGRIRRSYRRRCQSDTAAATAGVDAAPCWLWQQQRFIAPSADGHVDVFDVAPYDGTCRNQRRLQPLFRDRVARAPIAALAANATGSMLAFAEHMSREVVVVGAPARQVEEV